MCHDVIIIFTITASLFHDTEDDNDFMTHIRHKLSAYDLCVSSWPVSQFMACESVHDLCCSSWPVCQFMACVVAHDLCVSS